MIGQKKPEPQQQNSVVYFAILLVLEGLLILFTYVGGEREIIPVFVLRIILVVGTKLLKSAGWMVYYFILAVFSMLYVFDPVGLWMTGHGKSKTQTSNAFCVITFIGLGVAIYIGYLFKKTADHEFEEDFVGEGYSNANPKQNQKKIEQFSGQGYSLS